MVDLASLRAVPTLAPVQEGQRGPGSEQARLVFFSGEFPGSQLPNPEASRMPCRPSQVLPSGTAGGGL